MGAELPRDKERAYKRAVEIVDEFELVAKERLDGRRRALLGIWSCPREILLSGLRATLYDCPTYGVALDDWLRRYLDKYCNVRLSRPEALPPGYRQPVFSRKHEVEIPDDVYMSDGPGVARNASIDLDVGSQADDFYGS